MAEEPDRKRQRLEAPESAPILDVNSPARWDFLAPWCDELNGQLISIPSGFIRVLGPRKKLQKPMRFDWLEEEEKEEDKVDPEAERREFERSLWRTREAIELLSLVGKVDRQAFHMLVTEQCGLELDDDESDEEEQGFMPMLPWEGGMGFDLIDSEDGEDDEEPEEVVENEEENDGLDRDNGEGEAGGGDVEDEDGRGYVSDEDQYEEVLVVNPAIFKQDGQPEHETFVLPRFDFIALSGLPGREDAPKSAVREWQEFFLAEAPQYQPSDAYKKAKACILQMLDGNWSRIPRVLEIPVSLEFSPFADTGEALAGYLKELSSFIEAMKDRADKIRAESAKPQNATECAQTVTFTLVELSLTVSNRDKMTRLLTERLLGVLESGVHIGELHIYLTGQTDTAGVANHEALARLLSGMLVRAPSSKQRLPSFTELRIDCEDSALWEIEALCSALSISQVSIGELQLSGVCSDRKKDELRRKYWKVIAQTFFRPKSGTRGPVASARSLDLTNVKLDSDDLAEITAVLQDKEHQETIAQRWDVGQKRWILRENSPVQFIEKEGDKSVVVAGGPIKLPDDSAVELLENNNDSAGKLDDSSSDWLDVVVPAFGHCRAPRGSVVAVPAKDAARKRGLTNEPVASLSLACESDTAGVEGLLKLIGWSLRKVSLSFDREADVNAIMPTILSACPKLTELTLGDSYVDLDQFAAVYEDMGSSDDGVAISSLKFEDFYGLGDAEGLKFMKLLGDPTSRLAKNLLELTLIAEEYAEPLGHPTLGELWMALEKNSRLEKVEVMASRTTLSVVLKQRLRRFNGQVLPPRPLALPCKLAFLSAARPEGINDDEVPPALQRLDRRVLSLVFEFAATRVVRSVKVHG